MVIIMQINMEISPMEKMINIKDRLECFFDGRLIDRNNTTAEYRLHQPVRLSLIHI